MCNIVIKNTSTFFAKIESGVGTWAQDYKVKEKLAPKQISDSACYSIQQGSYWSWKTWKVMEFDNLDSRPGKSWNFGPSHGKSWNLILANMYAAYCSGLSEM